MDVESPRRRADVVASYVGLTDWRGRAVRFDICRTPEGEWLVDLSPHGLGIARPDELWAFGEGLLRLVGGEGGDREPDFPLFGSDCQEARAVAGNLDGDLYLSVWANGGYLELNPIETADPAVLAGPARALLATLRAAGCQPG
ncbi:hypothetical protein E1265_30660 [Streptomyces sp. 8K308]|uniref:hypothetical protein n=1 Tax=Streptomyces sp. 8K308 TaxID=2530388 RepID=UPI0010442B0D|nr:hypothetical protein [Streptomyces sp. 8K308]TDC10938.1 hypothetical protein E1265_30660 [Streptomyces sp. 8K308]